MTATLLEVGLEVLVARSILIGCMVHASMFGIYDVGLGFTV